MSTVFINGCFDILHRGHIELFKYGASLGDKLVVAIDSDKRVMESKGSNRPYNVEEDRVFLLGAIKYISEVHVFNSSDDLINLIKSISPDILIVGSDWRGKNIVGGEFAKQVLFFERIPGYSTTNIIEGTPNR